MRLHFESLGTGFPVVILHGLFGSLDNWQGFARGISAHHRVILPDLRNHGRSPHSASMSYPEMAEDVRALMDQERLEKAIILGHSMGGKAAMALALQHPQRVTGLIVVDIAPRQYERRHDSILNGLLGLELSKFTTRLEIEQALASAIPDLEVRRFLLKGLARNEGGRFFWRMGVNEIADNYENLGAALTATAPYSGPALFVRGELSSYLTDTDTPQIKTYSQRPNLPSYPAPATGYTQITPPDSNPQSSPSSLPQGRA